MSEIDEKLESYLKFLCQKAKELGASEAVAISASDIVVDEIVKMPGATVLFLWHQSDVPAKYKAHLGV